MKKFIATLFLSAILVMGTLPAMAFSVDDLDGAYVTPKVGASYVELDDIHGSGSSYKHEHDTTPVVGLSMGYDFHKKFELPLRAEVEYMYRGAVTTHTSDGKKFDNEAHTLMTNVAYDFKEVPIVTPYLTVGCGMAWLNDGGTNFAYNFGGGFIYNFDEHFAYDMSIRYVDYGHYVEHGYKEAQSGANIMAGFRYTF